MEKRPYIMAVDDDREMLHMLERILELEGYDVGTADNGRSALALLEEHEPDLVILDILMPDLDGYNACFMIKNDQATRRIPVVMLTALGYELNKKLAKEVGADGYITKPFTLEKLLDTIGKFLKIPK